MSEHYTRWRGELAASLRDTVLSEGGAAAAIVLTEGTAAAVEMSKHFA